MLVIKNAPTTAISEVDEQQHDHHELHMQAAEHSRRLLSGKVRATYACAEK